VNGAIEAVVVHPPVAARMKCSEHPLGQEDHAGDALAQDCTVVRDNGGPHGNFPSFYSGDGSRNVDWFGWNEPLLAPFDAIVRFVNLNQQTNDPGVRGAGMASVILFERVDSPPDAPLFVGYAHVQDVRVAVGDSVAAGEVVALIGNNGISDFPHVHVGAARGDILGMMAGDVAEDEVQPLQLRFDLAAMGRLQGYLP
jgi:murein DD-endopeptidase MepM/ murein hydrolase activator NlpD